MSNDVRVLHDENVKLRLELRKLQIQFSEQSEVVRKFQEKNDRI